MTQMDSQKLARELLGDWHSGLFLAVNGLLVVQRLPKAWEADLTLSWTYNGPMVLVHGQF